MSAVEGSSTPKPKAVIPKHVVAQLGEFNKALGEVEQALEKHFAIDFDQHIKNRTAADMSRIDVLSVFTLSSLGWVVAAMRGEDPDESVAIRTELARSKDYLDRLKELDSRKTAPRVNSVAAKNFVRNALWEIPTTGNDDSELSEVAQSAEAGTTSPPETKRKKK